MNTKQKNYNDALASRAELFLDVKVLKTWEKELKKMNKKKNGRRYAYPKCFIRYLALLRTYLGLTYRNLESLLSFLAKHIPILEKPDHSTLHRRITALNLNLQDTVKHKKGLIVSIDSSGLKVHNRGEWIRHKHRVRRGYLKIHFAINVKTLEIIELDTTREDVHDNRVFRPLIRKLLKEYTMKKVLADAAYDDHRNFNLLDQHGIIPGIKLRKNSMPFKWHPKWDRKQRIRRKYAASMCRMFKEWRRRIGYCKRWLSEIVYSCFKNNFGEYFVAKKATNIHKEVVLKACVHNMLMNHMQKF